MSPSSAVIDLEEFRKRRETKSAARPMSPMSPMSFWSPIWVWVVVWPS